MSFDSDAPPDPKPHRWILVTGLLSVVILALLLWLNLTSRHHPGFQDLRNPMAEAWSPDPRVERGWPFTAHRRFAQPSEVNARGVWDGLGLALDMGLLLGGLGLVWLAALLVHLRRR